MKRSPTLVPGLVSSLEPRIVLSAVHPIVAEVAKSHHKATHTPSIPPTDIVGVKQETFSTGLVQTTRRTLLASGNQVTAQDVITNSDGTSETDLATGTQSNGTVTVNVNKVFSSGVTQGEVDTETAAVAFGTLQADGTVSPGSVKAGVVATTNFTKVTTQAGLGTQVIVGTSAVGRVGKQVETITNQQVTNFDGTVDQVRIVMTPGAKSTVEHVSNTVTHADGSTVTTTSTIKDLSGSVDGFAVV